MLGRSRARGRRRYRAGGSVALQVVGQVLEKCSSCPSGGENAKVHLLAVHRQIFEVTHTHTHTHTHTRAHAHTRTHTPSPTVQPWRPHVSAAVCHVCIGRRRTPHPHPVRIPNSLDHVQGLRHQPCLARLRCADSSGNEFRGPHPDSPDSWVKTWVPGTAQSFAPARGATSLNVYTSRFVRVILAQGPC